MQKVSSLLSLCLQGYKFLRHWLPENPMHFDPSVMPMNFHLLFGIWGCGHALKKTWRFLFHYVAFSFSSWLKCKPLIKRVLHSQRLFAWNPSWKWCLSFNIVIEFLLWYIKYFPSFCSGNGEKLTVCTVYCQCCFLWFGTGEGANNTKDLRGNAMGRQYKLSLFLTFCTFFPHFFSICTIQHI